MKLIQSIPLVVGIKGAPISLSTKGVSFKDVNEDALNDAKRSLDEFFTPDREEATSRITNSLDVYRGVLAEARGLNAQYPTNAWSKYVELYTIIPTIINRAILDVRVGTMDSTFHAFCNAELPGSSISALNHVFKSHYPDTTLDWVASSYKPDGVGTMLEDKYGFLRGNPERWMITNEFASLINSSSKDVEEEEFNGDMMNTAVVKRCISMYRSRNPAGCDLYSHDAGIDVTVDTKDENGNVIFRAYEDQERANFKLHLGCAIVGLETLREGGTFIAKQYTLYEDNSRRLAELYANFFDEFYLIKPVTSRPYNSESYLVGVGYRRPRGADELISRMYDLHSLDTLDVISKHAGKKVNDYVQIFTDDLVDGAYAQAGITEYMRISAGRQAIFLKEMVRYLRNDRVMSRKAYTTSVDEWMKKAKLRELSRKDELAAKVHD